MANLSRWITLCVSWLHLPSSGCFRCTTFFNKAAADHKGQRGFSLIEVLVALGILGFIGGGLMSALGTGYRAQDINREQVRAQNLARAVLEYVRYQTYNPPAAGPYCYPDCYTVSISLPPGYTFTIKTEQFCTPEPCTPDHNIQKNTVKVFRGVKGLVTIEDLKTRR